MVEEFASFEKNGYFYSGKLIPDLMVEVAENIISRLKVMPMLTSLVALVAGILSAQAFSLPLWLSIAAFVVVVCVAWFWRSAASLLLLVFVVGVNALTLRRAINPPLGEECVMELALDRLSHRDDDLLRFDASLMAFADGGSLRRSNAQVKLVAPSSMAIAEGERLVARVRLRPFDGESSYGDYMLRRGFAGSIYLGEDDVLVRDSSRRGLSVLFRERALRRIEALGLSCEVEPLAAAISIGERSEISSATRRHYTLAGSAHLLAISGLHIGFVFVLVNLVLLPLLLMRHGQLLRSLIAVALIWAYAMVVNFTPSVVRAATMLSLLQLGLALNSRPNRINTLCAIAFVMLVWDARMIHDAGFLLSFIAVAAIFVWALPLRSLFRLGGEDRRTHYEFAIRHPLLGLLWRTTRAFVGWLGFTTLLGLVASLATMPLVSYLFGTISLWGVVVGAPMMLLCCVATCVVVVWVAFPLPVLAPVVGWVVEHVVGWMNGVAQWCASCPALVWDWSLSRGACLLLYGAYLLLSFALWSVLRRR